MKQDNLKSTARKGIKQAIIAAKKAGKLLIKMMPTDSSLTPNERSKLMDDADRKVHDCIYETIHEVFPHNLYISVFTKNQTYYKEGALWVIDPIVGLGNFGHGDPHYAISIALVVNNLVLVGVIYNPVFDELFTAIKNNGAFLNGKRLKVSITDKLKNSLLSTRFPYDIRREKVTNLDIFNNLILKAEGVLNHGTVTLDLAYVASGRYDGFWAVNMNPWDLIAAVLLIKEAGGHVSTLSGEDYFIESREILATNGCIHQEMINTISKISPQS